MIDTATNSIMNEVREVGLEYTHPAAIVVRNNLGRKWARIIAAGYLEKVGSNKRSIAVPSVDNRIPLVTKENCAAIVSTKYYHFLGFNTKIVNLSGRWTILKSFSFDAEESIAAEIREDETGGAIVVMNQWRVENIAF